MDLHTHYKLWATKPAASWTGMPMNHLCGIWEGEYHSQVHVGENEGKQHKSLSFHGCDRDLRRHKSVIAQALSEQLIVGGRVSCYQWQLWDLNQEWHYCKRQNFLWNGLVSLLGFLTWFPVVIPDGLSMVSVIQQWQRLLMTFIVSSELFVVQGTQPKWLISLFLSCLCKQLLFTPPPLCVHTALCECLSPHYHPLLSFPHPDLLPL